MKNTLTLALTIMITLCQCQEEGEERLVMDEIDKNEFVKQRAGMFVDLSTGHAIRGDVALLANANGEMVLRFENFSVVPGPDVNVYLSKTSEFKDVIDLGDLKGTEGNLNYELDKSVNTTEHPYVLVWCVKYAVLFGYAELK